MASQTLPSSRVFLFLQGPHGPFFNGLGRLLRATGADVYRVGFNAGDRTFWFRAPGFIPYRDTPENWPATCTALLESHNITDIVLYGDTRPIHAQAIAAARARGVTVHVFEEGYMRPYWVTYERGGSNGHSRLMDMTVADMQTALAHSDIEPPLPPAHWGDMRQHIFYGALYHWFVMFHNNQFLQFKPHRDLTVTQEFRLYLKRLVLMPFHAIDRRRTTRRIRNGGFPYHLALLQLEHDSSFQTHSPFSSMTDFITEIIDGFAKGAPHHHHLIFKAHPLEDGRVALRSEIRRLAKNHNVSDRVHYVPGGKLAHLLNDASTAVTVNSTAGQQVLWRGIPLKVFGAAVYAKPEFVSHQPLPAFFDAPSPPDNLAYKAYRRFLLDTSQVPGGYYSTSGRRRLLHHVVDMMLAPQDPYDTLKTGASAPQQQIRALT